MKKSPHMIHFSKDYLNPQNEIPKTENDIERFKKVLRSNIFDSNRANFQNMNKHNSYKVNWISNMPKIHKIKRKSEVVKTKLHLKCEICNKIFATKRNLRVHVESVHEKKETIQL